jgi:MFS family permease
VSLDASGGAVLTGFLLAVVEINDPMILVIAAVFILTFVGVCAVAYVVQAKRRPDGEQTTWQFGARLPLTPENFERVAAGTAAAVSVPEVTPATRATFERLDRLRGTFVSIYRIIIMTVGLAGLVAGGLMLRAHTPANMMGLPGAIALLLALGALLKGLVPGPALTPVEPLDPELLRQMRERISVRVITREPIAVKLEEGDIRRVSEMLRRGSSPGDALRAVYPDFDSLGDSEKRWIESTVSTTSATRKPATDGSASSGADGSARRLHPAREPGARPSALPAWQ